MKSFGEEDQKYYLTFDDWLDEANAVEVRRCFSQGDFVYRNRQSIEPVLGFNSGQPLEGPSWVFKYGADALVSKMPPHALALWPLARSICANTGLFEDLIGVPGKDWNNLVLRPTMFKAGDSHFWHTDSSEKAGAIIFYAHSNWSIDWGGELMVVEGQVPESVFSTSAHDFSGFHHDDGLLNEFLMERYGGVIVPPLPGHLVVLRAATFHTVRKVSIRAGQNARCAVSGFFFRK